MLPVSVFIIAKNEADRIAATIQAVRVLSDDIIVIDSGSTDGTQKIAEELGAKVLFNPWPGYGMQKRFGEDACSHDWLLNIDADEVVPSDLCKEIEALFIKGEPTYQAYTMRIAEIFPGESKPHSWAYSLSPVRFYNRKAGRYSPSPVHDRVVLNPDVKIGHLKGTVHHYSVRSLGDQIDKLNRYTDWQAEDMEQRGIKLSLWRVIFEFPMAFFKAYFVRRHFVHGLYGFLLAMNHAFNRHLRIAKHYERRLLSKVPGHKQEKDQQETS